MTVPYALNEPHKKIFVLGNEAIARGCFEAGVRVASGYPGTPSTEIVEALARIAKTCPEMHVEWGINEKVGFECAFGAAMAGVRATAVMKHVGLNVAMDAFMTAAYAGAKGGFVVICADDPNAYSSQNEQDTRLLARAALVPVFEPSNVMEAKMMTKFAFEFSEKYETLVILRSTTRLSHSRGDITLGPLLPIKPSGKFDFDRRRWTFLPINARIYRIELLKRLEILQEIVNELPFNQLHDGSERWGIIGSGVSNAYIEDVMNQHDLWDAIPYLKIGVTFPPPDKLIQKFISKLDMVVVIEELEPFIEEHVNRVAKDVNPSIKIIGKSVFPRNGELTPRIVSDALSRYLGKELSLEVSQYPIKAPPRPPVLCAGCPHRAFFYALKAGEQVTGKKFIFSSDIGCYTLGFFPPLETIDTCLCMGGSIGMANGLRKAGEEKPIFALLGDSTFFHSGIPSLANLVYNKSNIIVVVLDNLTTAMTGFQPHPGTGIMLDGTPSKMIHVEKIGESFGLDFIKIVDTYDLNTSLQAILDAVEWMGQDRGPGLIVARHSCSLLEIKGKDIIPYFIDSEKCTGCRICMTSFGCPPITTDGKLVFIDETQCVGCGVCVEVCPEKAIRRKEQ